MENTMNFNECIIVFFALAGIVFAFLFESFQAEILKTVLFTVMDTVQPMVIDGQFSKTFEQTVFFSRISLVMLEIAGILTLFIQVRKVLSN